MKNTSVFCFNFGLGIFTWSSKKQEIVTQSTVEAKFIAATTFVNHVGLIIGRGGETIKSLQSKSGARIQLIPQHLPEGDDSKERTVQVTGDKRQIQIAQELIKEVMNQVNILFAVELLPPHIACKVLLFWISSYVESLHINCGGKQVVVGDITYDEDMDSAGPTVFKQSRNNWTFSNTGHFVVNDTLAKQGKLPAYATENETRLYMTDAELYKNARISPISLTYYGFCLENGDYTVKPYFA
ncbi:putative LRR receptor-like serine/threonine-protein kinase [Glycine soja]|nr:putative LRR receptor-like serine/threonine-protein kinase [Glycine soja]